MPLIALNEPLGLKRAAHLLRRATFGATKQKIREFAEMTPATAIAQLFGLTLPDAVPPIDPKTGATWVDTGETGANSEPFELEEYFKGWFIGQMMSPGIDPQTNLWLAYSAREKLVFFLHTHFTTIQSKVSSSRALYFQNALYRMFALDKDAAPEINFKNLTVKVSVDNAMLRLLDGNLNVKGSVNENYARELLELYSIGRGLEANPPAGGGDGDYGVYTEDDVKTAARILSGWDFDDTFTNIDPDTGLPRGVVKGSTTNASSHDNDLSKPKRFSNRFVSTLFPNNTIEPDPTLMPGGVATEASALDEIKKLIDLIYEQDETARNICRKIYRFFVWAPHTKDEALSIESAPNDIIGQMVETFKASNFKIQPVIENLLCSRHFYDSSNGAHEDDNFGGIIKSPLDLVLGTLRIFNIPLPDMQTQAAQFYTATGEIVGTLGNLGMNFFEPYDVAGYEAYHQYPIYHRFWITPNTLARRYEFIRNVITEDQPGMFKVDAYQYVKDNFDDVAANARQLIIELAKYFLPLSDGITSETFEAEDADASLTYRRMLYFKDRFLQRLSQNDEAYWASRWNPPAGDLRAQLEFLFNAMLQTPEYQLA
jgi:uncharacterized protein (DUF1800 family)